MAVDSRKHNRDCNNSILKYSHFHTKAGVPSFWYKSFRNLGSKMVQTRIEERLEQIDQEILAMKKEIMKVPAIESSLNEISRNLELMRLQSDKQQMLLLVMESVTHESVSTKGKEKEASTSKSADIEGIAENGRNERKTENDDTTTDRSKFKKVEMPVFSGEDPDSWLFQAERYFQIHKLIESEKMLVSTISFDGPALNWYRSQEERDKFLSWANLKERLLIRFRSSRDGTLLGKFLRIKQETTVEEYRNLFDKLVAPLSEVQEDVVEDTFMNGLLPWIRAEVAFCHPKGLSEMMQVAQLVENREIIRNEAKLNNTFGVKNSSQSSAVNKNAARKEKGLCFRCNEKYSADHKCKMKELRELRMFVVAGENEEYEIIEEKEPAVKGRINNKEIIVMIDCGATHNFISEKLVKSLPITIKETAHYGVILGSSTAIQGKGVCESVEIQLADLKVTEDFLPLELGGVDAILGMQWLHALGVTIVDWKNLTFSFTCNGKSVCIKGDPSLTKTRISLKSMLKTWDDQDEGYLIECRAIEVKEDRKQQIVEKQESPWATNSIQNVLKGFDDVFTWPEKLPQRREIEHQIHLKEDYRAINNVTIPDKFPIPVVEELFDELNGASLFSKIDLKSGYHQIRMVEKDIPKTAFRTHEGHYEFLVMPFGLTNAPATFQPLMNTVFKPYLRKFVLVFFDDILVYSKNEDDHIVHLGKVLSSLREHSLYANKKKCSFAQLKVEYLGHIISGKGVEVDPEKIRSIAAWPTTTNVRETQGFLGLTGYNRRFVKHYGSIAAPLTQLLKKGGFTWNKEAEEAFEQLKGAMISLPVLALPNFEQPFEIETDASGVGVGAVLTQMNKPIAFYSHTLAMRDRAKPVYEREFMAVVLAVQRWRPYLLGTKSVVKTNQKSLKFEQRTIQPQYQKWVAKLLGYSFEVVYKPSLENKAADALSRKPMEIMNCGMSVPTLVDPTTIKEEVEKDEMLQKTITTEQTDTTKKSLKF
ncbi:Transposon Ty3-I Gag-Pol polyprotein [Cucumis melo var. makuwa]|uniref:Transposon Ty3-I Gag-Pol polyprotein n=1 Tax=Cucumis melo var. makuwa TaxID=1194695 RepID=A0A5A7VAG8_CUCMM|nr:Transposon Ty3-I Gag-Pol polyprotein [Cucumis melo var. makuwa]